MIKSSKLLTTSYNLIWKYFLSKIVHVQIKFEIPTLSNFDWDRETNWPVLTGIKKARVSERVKIEPFQQIVQWKTIPKKATKESVS